MRANGDQPQQLDLVEALDEAEGLDPWISLLPCPPWAEEANADDEALVDAEVAA
jgi:hypothetical protein